MSMMILALSMCSLAKHTLNEKNLLDVLHKLSPSKTAFPVLVKSIQIALTIAVSTAHREHSFSALKLTKSNLRSTMTQWLVDLAIELSTSQQRC